MVTLVSRELHQIKFPGGAVERRPPLAPISSTTVTVETGVVVFTLPGTNPHDWTRDTLAFPVGNPGPAANFVSGIASAAPTSFWTPMNNLTAVNVPPETIFVQVTGSDGVPLSGFGQVTFPGNTVPPPVGFAIDSSEVEYLATSRPACTNVGHCCIW